MEEIILSKLQSMDKPIVRTGDEWIMTTCLNPMHNDKHPSFAINTSTGMGKCFSCQYKVTPKFWLGELSTEEEEEIIRLSKYSSIVKNLSSEEEVIETHKIILPPISRPLEEGWRGVTKASINYLGLYITRVGAYKNRVIFPMKDVFGITSAFNSRALYPDMEPKYKYSKGIKPDYIVYPPMKGNSPYIVLVEGIMDGIHMMQQGIPAMFNFGCNYTFSKEKIKYLVSKGVDTIYIALDKDKAGEAATKMYLESELNDFFIVKHGKQLKELEGFYASSAKDFAEYAEATFPIPQNN